MKLINKRIYDDGEIWKNNSYFYHIDDGPGIENCFGCLGNICWRPDPNNKYNRHFYLNDVYHSPKEFARKTDHKICLICNDFCNQECFLLKKEI